MVDAGRAGAQTGWRDLFVAGLSLYPIAVDAGLKYWAELAASASSYHADVIQGGLAVLARPQCLGAVLDDLAGQFRQHLERWGESAERTMLEFNQRLEVALRSPAADSAAPAPQDDRQVAEALRRLSSQAASQAWKAEDPNGHPDLGALCQGLEELLAGLRAQGRVPPPPAAAGAAVPTAR